MSSKFFIKLIIFFIVSSLLCATSCLLFGTFNMPKSDTENVNNPTVSMPSYKTVIIDAGHGGEDGGTSSASGLIEKDINLSIAKMLYDMLAACGIDVVMTRDDDRLLYDRNIDYKGRKKKLDLAARLAVADEYDDAIFVSIHMNSFTDPHYFGLQVWYSPNTASSVTLADIIQSNNKKYLQPNNNRLTKAATSSIFILDNISCPAVLVECGFLSNPSEAEKFASDGYRQQVAFVIYSSILEFLNNESAI